MKIGLENDATRKIKKIRTEETRGSQRDFHTDKKKKRNDDAVGRTEENMLRGKEKLDENTHYKRRIKDDRKMKRRNSETRTSYVAVE